MNRSASHSGDARSARPPESVLRAWHAGEVARLPGGQGQAFRSDRLVFKPAPERGRSGWLAESLASVAPTDTIRVARPARSVDGRWVVDGWAAWHWLDGEPWTPSLPELLDVSARFHAAVASVAWGSAMRGEDRWAEADRIAWGEVEQPLSDPLRALVDARRPVPLACQLVHGDLHGNVLTHPKLAPAVIDISPYWRPPAYADAIVIVDRAVHRSENGALDPDLLGPHGAQLLLRAVLFRATSEPAPTNAHDRMAEQLLARV